MLSGSFWGMAGQAGGEQSLVLSSISLSQCVFFFTPLELFLIPNLISFDILIAGLTSLLESCAA